MDSSAWIAALTRPLMVFPFDSITLVRQIRPGVKYRDVPSHLFRNSILRRMIPFHVSGLWLRACYVYPLASTIPKWIETKFPSLNSIFPTLGLVMTISTLDAVMGVTPFERIKVGILNDNPPKGMSLLRGSMLTFHSSFVHTGSFLLMNRYLTPSGEIDAMTAVVMGTLFSAVQSTVAYPLLTLRARVQSDIFTYTKISDVVKMYTVKSLYSGWRVRFLRGIAIASFDTFWLSKIQK